MSVTQSAFQASAFQDDAFQSFPVEFWDAPASDNDQWRSGFDGPTWDVVSGATWSNP